MNFDAVRITERVVLIPIETYSREFFSKLLLAANLANFNFTVYVGSKSGITSILKNVELKDAFFIYKSGFIRPELMDLVKKKCKYIFCIDEELSPALNNIQFKSFFKYRSGSIKDIEKFFFINENFYKLACEIYPNDASKFVVSGWPRIDTWLNKNLFKKESDQIIEKFGDFLLFASNFGITSKRQLEKLLSTAHENGTFTPKLQSSLNLQYKSYKKFIDFLRANVEKSILPIVIRPHPGEDLSAWHQDVSSIKNVHIKYGKNISPWIRASKGLIHTGSTSAYEALVSNKPIYFWDCPETLSIYNPTQDISEHFSELQDLNNLVRSYEDNNNPNMNKPNAIEALNIHEMACLNISKCINEYDSASGVELKLSRRFKFLYFWVNFLRYIVRRGFSNLHFSKNSVMFSKMPIFIYSRKSAYETLKYFSFANDTVLIENFLIDVLKVSSRLNYHK